MTTATEVTDTIIMARTDVQATVDFQVKMAMLNFLDIITPARETSTAIRAAMVTTEAISMAEQVSPMAEDQTAADSPLEEALLIADLATVEASLMSVMMENLTMPRLMAAMPQETKAKDIMAVVDRLLEWEMA
jgi:hypothetical protein